MHWWDFKELWPEPAFWNANVMMHYFMLETVDLISQGNQESPGSRASYSG
jgi:hypothetical protein